MVFILDDVNQSLARFELSDVLTQVILDVEMHVVLAAGSRLGICGRRLILREHGRSEKKNSKKGSHITSRRAMHALHRLGRQASGFGYRGSLDLPPECPKTVVAPIKVCDEQRTGGCWAWEAETNPAAE
jgi:hypothetical protein